MIKTFYNKIKIDNIKIFVKIITKNDDEIIITTDNNTMDFNIIDDDFVFKTKNIDFDDCKECKILGEMK